MSAHRPAVAAVAYNDEPLIDPTTWERSRSYNFGYDSAGGDERQESADEAGTVTGSYQILDAQGLPLTVYYKARCCCPARFNLEYLHPFFT